jgi:cytochrome c6
MDEGKRKQGPIEQWFRYDTSLRMTARESLCVSRQFFDWEGIMQKQMYRIGKVILAGTVMAGMGFLSTLGRADNTAEATYKAKCATCHGADGKGETAAGKSMKAGSFADPEVAKMSDEDLSSAIEKGKNKMPAYGKSLKPDQIKDLVGYIRSLAKKG